MLILVLAVASVPCPAVAQVSASPELRAGRLLVRGMTRVFLDDDEGARALFAEALTLKPGDFAILAAMAELEARAGNQNLALDLAQQALAESPADGSMASLAAGLLLRAGRVQDALSVMRRHADAGPDDPAAWLRFGRLLREFEQDAEALDAYRRATGSTADETALRERLALELHLGRLDDALETATRLQTLGHGDASAERGRILVRLGRTDEARAAFSKALAATPGDGDLIDALAAIESDGADIRGEVRAAQLLAERDRARAQQALELLDESDGALWGRALLYAGRPCDALPVIQALADGDPREIRHWLEASEAAVRCGRADEADRLLDDGLLFFPGNPALMAWRMELALLDLQLDVAQRFDARLKELGSSPRTVLLGRVLDMLQGRALRTAPNTALNGELEAIESIATRSAFGGAVQEDQPWTGLAGGGLDAWTPQPDAPAWLLAAAAQREADSARSNGLLQRAFDRSPQIDPETVFRP